jgi:hypothetical protein
MNELKRSSLLLGGLLVISQSAIAHGPSAHVHGVASLQIAVDGPRLTLNLSSPLDSFLGFERAPRTDKEKAAAVDLLARLKKPEALLVPTEAAACVLASSKVDAPVLEGRPAPASRAATGKDGTTKAGDVKDKGKGREAEKDSDEHAELTAQYTFQCQRPENLRGLQAALFDNFRRLREINVQVVGPKGQSAAKLTRTKRTVTW